MRSNLIYKEKKYVNNWSGEGETIWKKSCTPERISIVYLIFWKLFPSYVSDQKMSKEIKMSVICMHFSY